eukprot:gb/GECH01000925.1/.p1 GENE.gb/GECH01000925.1/~~gb/GECH01000925.1/.p1  ORF type:complete len:503 (+),score=132.46 gb/GECH01000925.1/:1-1509(+)
MNRNESVKCVVCGDTQSETNFSCKYTVSDQTEKKYSDFFGMERLAHGPLCNRCYRSWYKGTHPNVMSGRKKKTTPKNKTAGSTNPGTMDVLPQPASSRYSVPLTRQRHTNDSPSVYTGSNTPKPLPSPEESRSPSMYSVHSSQELSSGNISNELNEAKYAATTSHSSARGSAEENDIMNINSAANVLYQVQNNSSQESPMDSDSWRISEDEDDNEVDADIDGGFGLNENLSGSGEEVDHQETQPMNFVGSKRNRKSSSLTYKEKVQTVLNFISENKKYLGSKSERIVTRRFWSKKYSSGGSYWMKMVNLLRQFRIVKANCKGGRRVEINKDLFESLEDVEDFLSRALEGKIPKEFQERLVLASYETDDDLEDSEDMDMDGTESRPPRKKKRKLSKSKGKSYHRDDTGNVDKSFSLFASNLGYVEKEMKMHRAGKLNAEIMVFVADLARKNVITSDHKKYLMRHVLENDNEQVFTNLVSAIELHKMGHVDLSKKVLSHLFQYM